MWVVFIGLYFVGLVLLFALQRFARWRDGRRFRRAIANYDRTVIEKPIVFAEPELSARSQYLLLRHQSERPMFAVPPLLDGGETVPNRQWGTN